MKTSLFARTGLRTIFALGLTFLTAPSLAQDSSVRRMAPGHFQSLSHSPSSSPKVLFSATCEGESDELRAFPWHNDRLPILGQGIGTIWENDPDFIPFDLRSALTIEISSDGSAILRSSLGGSTSHVAAENSGRSEFMASLVAQADGKVEYYGASGSPATFRSRDLRANFVDFLVLNSRFMMPEHSNIYVGQTFRAWTRFGVLLEGLNDGVGTPRDQKLVGKMLCRRTR